jgi:hypothetical protein
MKSIYLFLEELWTNRHNDASCESGKEFCSGFKSLRIKDFLELPYQLETYVRILLKIKLHLFHRLE